MCEVQSLGGLSTLLKADSTSIGSRVFEVLQEAMKACAESVRWGDINWRMLLADKLVPLKQQCPFLQEILLEHMTEDQTTIRATITRADLVIVMAGAVNDFEYHQKKLCTKQPCPIRPLRDNDLRKTSPKSKVAVFICHKSASSRAFRQDGYCIAATASWLWLWLWLVAVAVAGGCGCGCR